MILVGLKKVNDDTIKEHLRDVWNMKDFSSSCTNLIDEVELIEYETERTTVTTISHNRFIEDINEWLVKHNRIFKISIQLPFFSDDSIAEQVQQYIEERYPKLTFTYRPFNEEHKGRTVHLYYPMTPEVITELNKHHPEELI